MATTYHHTLLEIMAWNVFGQWMHFVFARNYSTYWRNILLPRFSDTAPSWWSEVHYYSGLWYNNLDNAGIPNEAFKGYYRGAARYHLDGWIADKARGIASPLVDAVSSLLGTLRYGYLTFSNWIGAIRGRVGDWVPWWTTTLAQGLDWLYGWLPYDIVSGLVTFYDKFVAWHEAAQSWVQANYDAAVTWASDAWDWVIGTGTLLNNWWLGIRDFLDGFHHFHVSWVKLWLGDPWSFLAGAWTELQNFYNNVWVPFKVTLHDFLDDPLGWMYDRVEDELIRRW